MLKTVYNNMFDMDKTYYQYVDDTKITLGRVLRLQLRLAKETMVQHRRVQLLIPNADLDTQMQFARRAAWFALYPKIFVRELNDAIYTEFYKK